MRQLTHFYGNFNHLRIVAILLNPKAFKNFSKGSTTQELNFSDLISINLGYSLQFFIPIETTVRRLRVQLISVE